MEGVKIARDFFRTFNVEPLDSSGFLLHNKNSRMLVRTHSVPSEDRNALEEMLELMERHSSFEHKFIAPLLHFEKCEEGVRGYYSMDGATLRQQLLRRQKQDQYFEEQDLWVLLSSVVDCLLYLQLRGAIYGVLSSSKILVVDRIRLMDPSAFNLVSLEISRMSLASPEMSEMQVGMDVGQSDVYLLGLCMLQAANLSPQENPVSKQCLSDLLNKIESRYSPQILHVIRHMLSQQPSQRPPFHHIREYIDTQVPLNTHFQHPPQTLLSDLDDLPSQAVTQGISDVEGKRDQSDSNNQLQNSHRKISQYERAKGRFLGSSPPKSIKILPPTRDRVEWTRESDWKEQNSRKVDLVGEFRLTGEEVVRKNKKQVRAVEIKNRNAEQVRKIESIRYQQTYTDPRLMTLLNKQTERAKEYLRESACS